MFTHSSDLFLSHFPKLYIRISLGRQGILKTFYTITFLFLIAVDIVSRLKAAAKVSFSYVKKETYPLPRTKVSAYCLSWIKAALFYYILTNNRKVLCWYSATHHALVILSPGGDGASAVIETVLPNHCSAVGHWVWDCYHHPKILALTQVLMDTRGWGSGLCCHFQSSISISGRALYLCGNDIWSKPGTRQWIHACGVTVSTSNLLFRYASWYLEMWLI